MFEARQIYIALLAGFLFCANAEKAEARWFEPQPHWWSSGRLCVGSRGPAARRWQALPPRSCQVARLQSASFERRDINTMDAQAVGEPKAIVDEMILADTIGEKKTDRLEAD